MIKLCLSALLALTVGISWGQNLDSLRYAFLNEKVNKDSLSQMPLVIYVMPLDTSCIVQTFLSSNEQDTMHSFGCNDLEPLLSSSGLGKYIDSSDIFSSFVKEYKDHKLHSISHQLNPKFREQITTVKNEKWDKRKFKNQLEFSSPKKPFQQEDKGEYLMSYPIFFGDMDKAILFVSMFYGPLNAQGYVEYYEKTDQGTWKRVEMIVIWFG